MKGPKQMRDTTPKYISVKVCEELKRLVEAEGAERGVPDNETVAQILAEYFDRPDLGYVPRDYRRGKKDLAPA